MSDQAPITRKPRPRRGLPIARLALALALALATSSTPALALANAAPAAEAPRAIAAQAAEGWEQDAGRWTYRLASGQLATGWERIGGSWFLFGDDGTMLTGWQQNAGAWYYLGTSGAMKRSQWQKWNGAWYYLGQDGAMLRNAEVDGCWLRDDGAWDDSARPDDLAALFPSWNADSAALATLVAFVQDVVDPESPAYREPADRIATFDMDGTIISEKAPMYLDYMLLIHRVLDDPDHKASDEDVAIIEQVRDYALQGKKNSALSEDRHRISDAEFAGMTPEEFRAYVNDFLHGTPVVGFSNMTYAESFYLPMREVVDYLRANDFDVYIVSACNREIARAVAQNIGIEPSHVVGANIAYAATGQGDRDPGSYNMGQDEDIVLSEPLVQDCEKTNKSIAIAREIGKRPVLSFGNSSGDYGMLNYAKASGGMACLVVADDEAREYGSAEKAEAIYQTVADEGWTAFSMRDDWATIYGPEVEKTGLPIIGELQ